MPFDAEYTYTPRERLLLIADALDDVQPGDFFLGSWKTCALGWGIKKHGSALGMKLDWHNSYTAPFFLDDGKYAFADNPPFRRLAKHLGIDERTCEGLFGGSGSEYRVDDMGRDPTPKEAASRIRWVADHKMVARSRLNLFHILPSLRNLAA